jgi:hypothetical protein
MELVDESDVLETEFNSIKENFRDFLKDEAEQNFCCNDQEKRLLLSIAEQLKTFYPEMSNKDICLVVLYTYYSLTLNEQTRDPLSLNQFKNFANNFDKFKEVYLNIATGDNALFSKIRRQMMGLRPTGLIRNNNNNELQLPKYIISPLRKRDASFSSKHARKDTTIPHIENFQQKNHKNQSYDYTQFTGDQFKNYKASDFKFGGHKKRRKTNKKRKFSRKRRHTKRRR